MTKVCAKCGETKDGELFWPRSDTKDGLSYYCKDCCRVYNTMYRNRARNMGGVFDQLRGKMRIKMTGSIKYEGRDDKAWKRLVSWLWSDKEENVEMA